MPKNKAQIDIILETEKAIKEAEKLSKTLSKFDEIDVQNPFKDLDNTKDIERKQKELHNKLSQITKKQMMEHKNNEKMKFQIAKEFSRKLQILEKAKNNRLKQLYKQDTQNKLKEEKTKLSKIKSMMKDKMEGFSSGGGGGLLGSLGGVVGKLGPIGMAIGAAVAGLKKAYDFLVEAGKKAAALETSMAKIKTLIGDTKGISTELHTIAKQTASDVTELSQALYFAFSAGTVKTKAEISGFMKDIAKFAKSIDAPIQEATRSATGFMNQLGWGAERAGEAMDLLAQLMNKGIIKSGSELAQYAPQIAINFKQIGLSANEYVAALASITAQGIQTSEVITKLKAVTENMKNASTIENLSKAGVQGFDAITRKITDMNVFLDSMKEKGYAAMDAFSSNEAKDALAILMNETEMGFKTMAESFENVNGTVDRMFGIMSDTTDFKTKQVEARWNEFTIGIGDVWNDVTGVVKLGLIETFDLFESSLEKAQKNLDEMKRYQSLFDNIKNIEMAIEVGDTKNVDNAFKVLSKNLDNIRNISPVVANKIDDILSNKNMQTKENLALINKELKAIEKISAFQVQKNAMEALNNQIDDLSNAFEKMRGSKPEDMIFNTLKGDPLENYMKLENLEKYKKARDNLINQIEGGDFVDKDLESLQIFNQLILEIENRQASYNQKLEKTIGIAIQAQELDKYKLETAKAILLANEEIADAIEDGALKESDLTNELEKQLGYTNEKVNLNQELANLGFENLDIETMLTDSNYERVGVLKIINDAKNNEGEIDRNILEGKKAQLIADANKLEFLADELEGLKTSIKAQGNIMNLRDANAKIQEVINQLTNDQNRLLGKTELGLLARYQDRKKIADNLEKAIGTLRDKADSARNKATALDKVISKMEKSSKKTSNQIKKLGGATKKAGKAAKETANDFEKFQKQIGDELEKSLAAQNKMNMNHWDKQRSDAKNHHQKMLKQLQDSLNAGRLTQSQYHTLTEQAENLHKQKLLNIDAAYRKAVNDKALEIKSQTQDVQFEISISELSDVDKALAEEEKRFKAHLEEIYKEFGNNKELMEEAEVLHGTKIQKIKYDAQRKILEEQKKAENNINSFLKSEQEKRITSNMSEFELELHAMQKAYKEQLKLAKKHGLDMKAIQAEYNKQIMHLYKRQFIEVSKESLSIIDNFMPSKQLSALEKGIKDITTAYERLNEVVGNMDNKVGKAMNSVKDLEEQFTAAKAKALEMKEQMKLLNPPNLAGRNTNVEKGMEGTTVNSILSLILGTAGTELRKHAEITLVDMNKAVKDIKKIDKAISFYYKAIEKIESVNYKASKGGDSNKGTAWDNRGKVKEYLETLKAYKKQLKEVKEIESKKKTAETNAAEQNENFKNQLKTQKELGVLYGLASDNLSRFAVSLTAILSRIGLVNKEFKKLNGSLSDFDGLIQNTNYTEIENLNKANELYKEKYKMYKTLNNEMEKINKTIFDNIRKMDKYKGLSNFVILNKLRDETEKFKQKMIEDMKKNNKSFSDEFSIVYANRVAATSGALYKNIQNTLRLDKLTIDSLDEYKKRLEDAMEISSQWEAKGEKYKQKLDEKYAKSIKQFDPLTKEIYTEEKEQSYGSDTEKNIDNIKSKYDERNDKLEKGIKLLEREYEIAKVINKNSEKAKIIEIELSKLYKARAINMELSLKAQKKYLQSKKKELYDELDAEKESIEIKRRNIKDEYKQRMKEIDKIKEAEDKQYENRKKDIKNAKSYGEITNIDEEKLIAKLDEKKLKNDTEYQQRKTEIHEHALKKRQDLDNQYYENMINRMNSVLQSAMSMYDTLNDKNANSMQKFGSVASTAGGLIGGPAGAAIGMAGGIASFAGGIISAEEEEARRREAERLAKLAEMRKNIEESINELIKDRNELLEKQIELNVNNMKELRKQIEYWNDEIKRGDEILNDMYDKLIRIKNDETNTFSDEAWKLIQNFSKTFGQAETSNSISKISDEELLKLYEKLKKERREMIRSGKEEETKMYDVMIEGLDREFERREKINELIVKEREEEADLWKMKRELGEDVEKTYRKQREALVDIIGSEAWQNMTEKERIELLQEINDLKKEELETLWKKKELEMKLAGYDEDSFEWMEAELKHLEEMIKKSKEFDFSDAEKDDIDYLKHQTKGMSDKEIEDYLLHSEVAKSMGYITDEQINQLKEKIKLAQQYSLSEEELLEIEIRKKELTEKMERKRFSDRRAELEHEKKKAEFEGKEYDITDEMITTYEQELDYLKTIGASEEELWNIEEKIWELKKAQTDEMVKQNTIYDDQIIKLIKLRQQMIRESEEGGYKNTAEFKSKIKEIEEKIISQLKENGATPAEIEATLRAFRDSMPAYETGGMVNETGPILAHAGELVIPADITKKFLELVKHGNYQKKMQELYREIPAVQDYLKEKRIDAITNNMSNILNGANLSTNIEVENFNGNLEDFKKDFADLYDKAWKDKLRYLGIDELDLRN